MITRILRECLPLFLMSFVLIYLSNAPKYAIDRVCDSEIQAYYGFISMPVFAISLLSGFLFQPRLAQLSRLWKEAELDGFRKIFWRHMGYILIISVGSLLLGWVAGIPVLSALYGVHGLETYKGAFMILLLGGCGTAVINYLSAILVIFRKQSAVLWSHAAAGIGIFLSISPVLRRSGISGAVWDAAFFIWLLAVALLVFSLRCLWECKKEHS